MEHLAGIASLTTRINKLLELTLLESNSVPVVSSTINQLSGLVTTLTRQPTNTHIDNLMQVLLRMSESFLEFMCNPNRALRLAGPHTEQAFRLDNFLRVYLCDSGDRAYRINVNDLVLFNRGLNRHIFPQLHHAASIICNADFGESLPVGLRIEPIILSESCNRSNRTRLLPYRGEDNATGFYLTADAVYIYLITDAVGGRHVVNTSDISGLVLRRGTIRLVNNIPGISTDHNYGVVPAGITISGNRASVPDFDEAIDNDGMRVWQFGNSLNITRANDVVAMRHLIEFKGDFGLTGVAQMRLTYANHHNLAQARAPGPKDWWDRWLQPYCDTMHQVLRETVVAQLGANVIRIVRMKMNEIFPDWGVQLVTGNRPFLISYMIGGIMTARRDEGNDGFGAGAPTEVQRNDVVNLYLKLVLLCVIFSQYGH